LPLPAPLCLLHGISCLSASRVIGYSLLAIFNCD